MDEGTEYLTFVNSPVVFLAALFNILSNDEMIKESIVCEVKE